MKRFGFFAALLAGMMLAANANAGYHDLPEEEEEENDDGGGGGGGQTVQEETISKLRTAIRDGLAQRGALPADDDRGRTITEHREALGWLAQIEAEANEPADPSISARQASDRRLLALTGFTSDVDAMKAARVAGKDSHGISAAMLEFRAAQGTSLKIEEAKRGETREPGISDFGQALVNWFMETLGLDEPTALGLAATVCFCVRG